MGGFFKKYKNYFNNFSIYILITIKHKKSEKYHRPAFIRQLCDRGNDSTP